MKIFLILTILILQSSYALSFDHSHAQLNQILKKVVLVKEYSTQVNYIELQKLMNELKNYTNTASAVAQSEYNTWTEKQKIAFLVNTYNSLTLQLVSEELKKNPNLKSIKKIGGLFSSPWKIKFFKLFGKDSYLDEIEQEIARPAFDEPRMHMAFNCASIGCPALQPVAFQADRLDQQLDQAAKDFLSDSSRNRYDAKNKILYLSSIFKWYKGDFEKSKKLGPLVQFVIKYMNLNDEAQMTILKNEAQIKFLDYDWNLNSLK